MSGIDVATQGFSPPLKAGLGPNLPLPRKCEYGCAVPERGVPEFLDCRLFWICAENYRDGAPELTPNRRETDECRLKIFGTTSYNTDTKAKMRSGGKWSRIGNPLDFFLVRTLPWYDLTFTPRIQIDNFK